MSRILSNILMASILFACGSTLRAQDDRVDRIAVKAPRIWTAETETTVDIDLGEPFQLDGHYVFILDSFHAGLRGGPGRAELLIGMAVLSENRVVGELEPTTGWIGGDDFVIAPPVGVLITETDALVDGLRLTVGFRNPSDPGGAFETWLTPHSEDETMALNFIRGNHILENPLPGRSEIREVEVGPMSLVGEGSTPWRIFSLSPPVEASGLAYVLQGPLVPFTGGNPPIRVVSELIFNGDFDDDEFVPIDDPFSPSNGMPVPGEVSTGNTRYFDPAERASMKGLKIVGWRMKLVAGPGGSLSIFPDPNGNQTAALAFFRDFSESPDAPFRRGDANGDGTVDISDPVFNLEFQFLGEHDPGCLAALDTNADGAMDISDPVYNLEHQFLGRPAPPAPYPDCGPESLPAGEALSCETQPANCP